MELGKAAQLPGSEVSLAEAEAAPGLVGEAGDEGGLAVVVPLAAAVEAA